VRSDLRVRELQLPQEQVLSTPGLVRSFGRVPPESSDGLVRVVEIGNLDRQACGGTHVSRTGLVGGVILEKVENKGRHYKRISFSIDSGVSRPPVEP
jgi:misacylated tRNA(Ala) deacylase